MFYAHSDLSGLSLIEEAQDLGIAAAERVPEQPGVGRSPGRRGTCRTRHPPRSLDVLFFCYEEI
jgi:hypothetical protein